VVNDEKFKIKSTLGKMMFLLEKCKVRLAVFIGHDFEFYSNLLEVFILIITKLEKKDLGPLSLYLKLR